MEEADDAIPFFIAVGASGSGAGAGGIDLLPVLLITGVGSRGSLCTSNVFFIVSADARDDVLAARAGTLLDQPTDTAEN